MAIAKAVTWPSEAGSIATAATPVGTLATRNSSRSRQSSPPSRLYWTAKPIHVHHSTANSPSAVHTPPIDASRSMTPASWPTASA